MLFCTYLPSQPARLMWVRHLPGYSCCCCSVPDFSRVEVWIIFWSIVFSPCSELVGTEVRVLGLIVDSFFLGRGIAAPLAWSFVLKLLLPSAPLLGFFRCYHTSSARPHTALSWLLQRAECPVTIIQQTSTTQFGRVTNRNSHGSSSLTLYPCPGTLTHTVGA